MLMVPLLSMSPALLDPVTPIVIVLSLSISENAVLVRTPVSLVVIVPVAWLLITPSSVVSVPSPLVREPVPLTAIAPKLSIIPVLVIEPEMVRVVPEATSMDVPLLAMEPLLVKSASRSRSPLLSMEPLLV